MLSLSADPSASASSTRSPLRRLARWFRWRLPTRISAHRILSGPLRGKRIVTSWRDYPAAIAGITEPQLLGWFARNVKKGETWLDIGAHYGYTALSLSDLVGADGRVFAFEPMAATVGCLARTRQVNGLEWLTVVPLALGATEGIHLEKLATVRGMVDSTLKSSQEPGGSSDRWSEMILVAQMDWLWSRLCGERPEIHGVKIDVQGMELHVLRGMAANLRRHRPKLVVEFHRGVDRTEALRLLQEVGYSLAAIPLEPVTNEVEPRFVDDRSYAFSFANGS
jgi:FkbM family methyltransferase